VTHDIGIMVGYAFAALHPERVTRFVVMDSFVPGTSSTGIFDTGTVRVGALSPSFPANRSGPPKASDTSKVRIGALSPAFPALRTK
jgi:pimeloyl-ACP methyl ester carboxylesterase